MREMPGPWIVNVAGRAYGPYGVEQMRSFASEGRLVAMSRVARAGETEFRNAVDDPELAQFFVLSRPAGAAVAEPLHAREHERQPAFGKLEENNRAGSESTPALSHIIVVADMKSRPINGLEDEIVKLGQACPILPRVWLLSTEASVSAVRNLLVQQLGKLDTLFIVDATRDKAAWFNFAPEMEARIRRLWSKQSDTKSAA